MGEITRNPSMAPREWQPSTCLTAEGGSPYYCGCGRQHAVQLCLEVGTMEHRAFGQTGIQISAVGFGCWEIGGGYGSIEETEFVKAINRALDIGINSFDTAEAYGMGASEKSLAKALGSRRKEAVITTKFGVGYPDFPNYRDSSRKRVIESIEKSLKALNTDYAHV